MSISATVAANKSGIIYGQNGTVDSAQPCGEAVQLVTAGQFPQQYVKACFGFSPPANIRQSKITGCSVSVYGRPITLVDNSHPVRIGLYGTDNESNPDNRPCTIYFTGTDWQQKSGNINVSSALESIRSQVLIWSSTYNSGRIDIAMAAHATMHPVATFTADIITPTVMPDFPSAGGRAIKGLVNRFAWHLDYDATNIVDPIAQASAKLRIRTAGQTAYTEYAVPSGAMYYDLPANTLKADSIEWSVEVTTVPGAVSSSAWTTVSTVDDSSSPVCVSPVSEIVTDTDGITFAWQHIIASGSPQTGFELAYSQNAGSSWTTFATGAGAAQSYKAQHGAIPFGSILWRVRTKNSDSTFGSWSSPAYISVTGVPDTPVLSFVGTAPQLKLSWQSSGQQGYQVRIGEFDSGTIFGTAKTYTYNGCLPDGPVTVSVRVANVQGKWSAWASLTAVITNQGSGAITLTTRDGPLAVSLSWATEQTFDYFMVLRDGQPIAKTTDKSYTDALCVGKHQYVVRGMAAGNYTDSETRVAIVTPKHTLISAIDCIDWVHLVYNRGGPPVHSGSLSQSVQLVHYAGRALPVAYTDGTRSGEDQYTFAVRSRLDLSKLQNLIGKTIIIKDWRGDLSTGVLVSVTPDFYTKSIGVKLALDKTDFVEVVEYD